MRQATQTAGHKKPATHNAAGRIKLVQFETRNYFTN